jgi:2-iminobutanoate/2-iminopropanoate deaminase
LDKVVSRRLYMIERAEFTTVDSIWASYMKEPYPVSTLIGVTWLAKDGAMIEIEVVAEA